MATGRKTARRRRGKKKAAPARKKARKARPKARARKVAKTRRRPKVEVRARRTKAKTRPRTRAKPARRPPVARPEPTPVAMPAAAPAAAPAAPAGDAMQGHVEQALRDEGYDEPDQTAVAVLAAIGRGYARGPAQTPAWLRVDANGPIAEGIAERFAIGDRAHDIDRSTHRPQVRATVNFNLDPLGGGDASDAERDVLTSFSLGSWDPAMDANAERHGIASFVIPWYLDGR